MKGIRAVLEALRLEDYPMAKSDIDYAVGDIEVEDGRGGFVPVRQLTDRIRREKFDSPEEVIRALEASRDNLKSQAA